MDGRTGARPVGSEGRKTRGAEWGEMEGAGGDPSRVRYACALFAEGCRVGARVDGRGGSWGSTGSIRSCELEGDGRGRWRVEGRGCAWTEACPLTRA